MIPLSFVGIVGAAPPTVRVLRSMTGIPSPEMDHYYSLGQSVRL